MAGAGGLGGLYIDIEARMARFESDIGRAARLMEREMRRASGQAAVSVQRLEREVAKQTGMIRRNFATMGHAFVGVFGVIAIARFTRELVRVNDGYINIQLQLRQTTKNQEELTRATKETFDISQRTFTSFESTGFLVGRTARALKSAGVEQATAMRQSLHFVEAINNAFILSGAKAIEAKNALMQLSQGLASGTLRGDEYRSVAEQGAKVTEILAKNLSMVGGELKVVAGGAGITTGQLRDFAYNGLLKTSLVVEAMSASFVELSNGIALAPVTIERAMLQLTNAFEFYIGSSEDAVAIGQSVAKSLQWLAENFETVASAAIYLGEILLVTYGTRQLAALSAFIQLKLRENAVLVASANAAKLESSTTLIRASNTARLAVLTREQAALDVLAAKALLDKTRADTVNAANAVIMEARRIELMIQRGRGMAALRSAEALMAKDLILMNRLKEASIILDNEMVIAQARLTEAKIAALTTQKALTAASVDYAKKQAAVTAATLSFGTIAKSTGGFLLGLVGGFQGLALILGGTLLYSIYEALQGSEEIAKAIEDTNKIADNASRSGLNALTNSLIELSQAYISTNLEMDANRTKLMESISASEQARQAALREAEAKLQLAKANQASVEKANPSILSTVTGGLFGSDIQDNFSPAVQAARRQVEELEAAVSHLSSNQAFERRLEGWAASLHSFTEEMLDLGRGLQIVQTAPANFDDIDKQIDNLRKQNDQLRIRNIELTKGTKTSRLQALADQFANKSIEELLASEEEHIKKLVAETLAGIDLEDQNKRIENSRKRAKKDLKDLESLERKQAKAVAEEARHLEALADIYDNLDKVIIRNSNMLSGPMQDALEQNRQDTEALREAEKNLFAEMSLMKDGGDAVVLAFNKLAEALQLANEKAQERIEIARKEEDIYAQTEAAYAEQIRLLGMSNEQREVELALLDAKDSADRKNVEWTPELEQSLRSLITAREEYIRVLRQQQEDEQRLQDIITQGLEGVADVFGDFIANGMDDWKSFTDGLKNIWKRTIAAIISEAIKINVIRPLLQSLFSGAGGGGGGAGWLGGLLQVFSGALGGGGGMMGGGGGGGFGNLLGTVISAYGGGGGGGGGFGNILGSLASNYGGGSGNMLSSIGSWFGLGASAPLSAGYVAPAFGYAGSMFGASGAAAAGVGVYSPAVVSAMSSYGVAATSTGVGSAATAGMGAAASVSWIPIIGWIIAAIMANDALFQQGWRRGGADLTLPNNETIHGGGSVSRIGDLLGFGGLISTLDHWFRGFMDDRTAALFSGSAIHTRLWGRKAPILTEGEANINLGPGGVSGTERYRTHEQGGLFRSDRNRWHAFDFLSESSMESALQLFDALEQVIEDAARQLGIEAPAMMAASLQVVNEYTKKGEIKSTKYFVNMLGRSWEEATAELATTRLNAEAIIHTIDSVFAPIPAAIDDAVTVPIETIIDDLDGIGGRFGDQLHRSIEKGVDDAATGVGEASQIAERWRDDAEMLMAGAQFLLVAATDMQHGFQLLGEEGTLTQITDLVEDVAYSNESLIETYQRVVSSTKLLEQALKLSGVNLNLTREEFVRFAIDITDAAGGLERASSLWNRYFESFYSANERAALSVTDAESAASAAFAEIGLSINDFAGSEGLARFRQIFEKILPGLTAAQIVEWLEAADALVTSVEAQAAYNQAIDAGVAMLSDALGVMGASLNITGAAFTDFATAIVEAAGGLEQAQSLWADYFNMYFSDSERAAASAHAMQISASNAFSAIGLSLSDFSGGDGMRRFRDLFGTVLPNLTAEQTVLWLAAARALGMFNSTASQLVQFMQGVNQGIADTALALRQFDMTPLELQLDNINTAMENSIRAAMQMGASEQDLARIRQLAADQTTLVMQQAARDLQALLGGLQWEDSLAGMNEQEQAIAQVNRHYEGLLAQAQALGATKPQLEELMRLWERALDRALETSEELDYVSGNPNLREFHFDPNVTDEWGNLIPIFDDLTTSSGNLADNLRQLTELMDNLAFTDSLRGMSDIERQLAQINRQWDQTLAQAIELGATTDQQALIQLYRQHEIEDAIADADKRHLEAVRAYQKVVEGINQQINELSGMSEFQLALARIGQTLESNIESLNDAAEAAGMQSASEEDLGRAHLLAALQAAQAADKLEESGKKLAEALYGTPLSRIEDEIRALGGSADGASSAIGSLGSSISLLLGNLSPLRDKQKLSIAIDALRRGEVTADDVLQIGRRLLSSGSDYARLFAEVQQISGTGGSGDLAALYRERERLRAEQEAAQRFTQGSELAQIVADLAGARGQDFADVSEYLGFSLGQLAADLHLSNIAELADYLTTLQADSYGLTDIANTITAGDELIANTILEVFGVNAPPVVTEVDPPSNPAEESERPVERELIDRIGALEIAVTNALSTIAFHTMQTSTNTKDTVEELEGIAASQQQAQGYSAMYRARSTR